MIINNNMNAMNAHRNMSFNTTQTGKSMEKLSSGLRINRAGDDAAGLAISEKMRGQIRGLDQATRNSQDSISLIQTAEGALNETHSILQRMRELAVQSGNDTNTVDDRNEIQKEISQLTSEVDRISATTEFNTKKLLNGESGSKANFGSNANVLMASASEEAAAGTYTVATTVAAEQATTDGGTFTDAAITAGLDGAQTVKINNQNINFNAVSGDAEATATNFINALNSANVGLTANGDAATTGIDLNSLKYGSDQSITIEASAITAAMGLTADATTDTSDIGVDVAGTINGVAASGKGTTLTGSGAATGVSVTLTNTSASAAAGARGDVVVTQNALTAQIGANADQNISISISSMSSSDLGIAGLDLTSQSGANSAITLVDNAIKSVSGERSKLGSVQNRLEHTINNLSVGAENLQAAESRVRDVDMAKEMMSFTKNNILNQAAQAMMAQSKSQPEAVLQLLR
ncbi:flagellin [Exiguobacterium sp. SH5S4]|uniref:flagellin N-terminal helical domain-containing protein n=1 Tax=Exiguobacterium sp. SH5S4 TaxID=2510961 RepID=UPI00103DCA82|nr:flagellin [Exiguobacterium sp. SH5S4]TCI27634.1 flagellin [Exiguobacterium sp. SH5S4]